MNTLRSHYLYNLDSSNIYKYWLSDYSTCRGKKSTFWENITDPPAIFIPNMYFNVLFPPLPVLGAGKKQLGTNWSK